MNLCDSCKKWEGCGTPKFADGNSVVECARFAPIARADLAARDAEIAQLSEARRVVPGQWVYHVFASYQGDHMVHRHVWDGIIQRSAPITDFDAVLSLKSALMDENFTECRAPSRIVIESISLLSEPSIPAARVLKDGEVGVSVEDADLFVQWYHALKDMNPLFLDPPDVAAYDRIKLVRTAQAKGATP